MAWIVLGAAMATLVGSCGSDDQGAEGTGTTKAPASNGGGPLDRGSGGGTTISAPAGDGHLEVTLPDGWVGGSCVEVEARRVQGVSPARCTWTDEEDAVILVGQDRPGEPPDDCSLYAWGTPGGYEIANPEREAWRNRAGLSGTILPFKDEDDGGCPGGEVEFIAPGFGAVQLTILGPRLTEVQFEQVVDSARLVPDGTRG